VHHLKRKKEMSLLVRERSEQWFATLTELDINLFKVLTDICKIRYNQSNIVWKIVTVNERLMNETRQLESIFNNSRNTVFAIGQFVLQRERERERERMNEQFNK
jgi:hypothetical protein